MKERKGMSKDAEGVFEEDESRKRITTEWHYVELMRDEGKRNYMRSIVDS